MTFKQERVNIVLATVSILSYSC